MSELTPLQIALEALKQISLDLVDVTSVVQAEAVPPLVPGVQTTYPYRREIRFTPDKVPMNSRFHVRDRDVKTTVVPAANGVTAASIIIEGVTVISVEAVENLPAATPESFTETIVAPLVSTIDDPTPTPAATASAPVAPNDAQAPTPAPTLAQRVAVPALDPNDPTAEALMCEEFEGGEFEFTEPTIIKYEAGNKWTIARLPAHVYRMPLWKNYGLMDPAPGEPKSIYILHDNDAFGGVTIIV